MIDKILAEIERLIKNPRLDEEYNPAYQCGLRDLRSLIESLEKEQSTMPNSTELIAKWEETKKMLEEKDFRGDAWRLAYNAFLEGFAKGVNVKKPSDWIREQVDDRDDDDALIAEKLKELHQIRAEKEPRDCGKGIHKQEYTGCDMSWMDEDQRLDEAAEEYANKYCSDCAYHLEYEAAFEAGAKWDAEQGETVEGEIVCAVAYPHENKVIARVNGDYRFGDKVIVQIKKADEGK